jgi:hypothetical protein
MSSRGEGQEERELLATARVLVERGFFDEAFYAGQFPSPPDDLFAHYFLRGYREGRAPNPVFDTRWYLSTYPDVALSGLNPLLDYVAFGEKAGRDPSPLFDAQWYRARYRLDPSVSPLLHYLQNRHGAFSPIPEFDAEYYLAAYPDVAAARYDPFAHYCLEGFKEGRNPSAHFNTRAYAKRFLKNRPEFNPLVHHRLVRKLARLPAVEVPAGASFAEVRKFTRPGQDFSEFSGPVAGTPKRAKALAVYRSHGDAEWAQLLRGQPRFAGHYQPRTPRDLGFYSPNDADALRRQAAMAQSAGLSGFVFEFGQPKEQKKPLEMFLGARDIGMPFCLICDVLEWRDNEAFCAELARPVSDSRQIRIKGRPLLMLRGPGLAAAAIADWRRIFREKFDENPLLVMAQSPEDSDPRAYGLDGAVEMPPRMLLRGEASINAGVELFDPAFSGEILAYDQIAAASISAPAPDFPLIKTVAPGWDDDPRREGAGLCVHGSTPAKYQNWLAELIERARERLFFGEAIVCIDAWNDWTGGACLEPDVHFGSAYLNATAQAIHEGPSPGAAEPVTAPWPIPPARPL